jgi:tetratricopeptide (TPR) repeat protein
VVVVLVAGGIGWQIYTWRTAKTTAKHSDALAEALDAETGVVGQSDDEDDPFAAIVDRFSDDAARLQRASEAYRKAYSSKPTSGIGLSAKLGLAGVLFEQSKYDEAMKAYREVLGSALGKQDPSVHGRALEGIGLCLESKGDDAGAAREFGRLANSDVAEFRVLGLYHQARMALKQGDKAKAKDLLTQARDKLTKSPNITGPSYLDQALKELALAVDPAGAGSGLSGAQLQALSSQIGSDPARLQKLMDDIRKNTLAESQQPAVPEQAPEDVEQDTEAEPTAPGNAKPQAPPEPPPANSQPTQEKSPASQETAP